MVGPDVADELLLSGIGNEVFDQHQRDHFAVAKRWFRARFPFQHRLPFALIPVIHQHVDNGQKCFNVYTRHTLFSLDGWIEQLPNLWKTALFVNSFHIERILYKDTSDVKRTG